ncbi:hypothetical protein CUT44_21055 [Streptomyces carminius]|uniref:IrrE N-terminal-like domain-containing protein n=1 Tax=Streptomyces carminius TaxID=2665496 RepID=A0A2M8LUX4_9ACTN|nr:hypothetical protein [Streptomyces carminius]PJE95756.1 hypothetical protein CUT44_21055 [Streptomyces carminius]
MRERELRRRCRRLLNELGIRPPLDVAELCHRVALRRGRPLHLVPYPIPVPGPFGMWVGASSADYIVYQRETSRAHQRHIVLHELGHLLADHRSDEYDDGLLTELRRGTEPCPPGRYPDLDLDLDPGAVRRALRRTAYDSEQEREAETVATIILEWASVLDHVVPRSPSSDAAADRIGTSLGDRLGWL